MLCMCHYWGLRNGHLFQGSPLDYDSVVSKTLDCLSSGFDPAPKPHVCIFGFPSLPPIDIVGFFDGAEQ